MKEQEGTITCRIGHSRHVGCLGTVVRLQLRTIGTTDTPVNVEHTCISSLAEVEFGVENITYQQSLAMTRQYSIPSLWRQAQGPESRI
jgi:hypothetical protein